MYRPDLAGFPTNITHSHFSTTMILIALEHVQFSAAGDALHKTTYSRVVALFLIPE
jgi:hypothetical protein